jgi:hypothetical protein
VSAGDLKLLGAYFDVGSGGLAIYARARVSLRRRWNCCCSERGFTPALKNSGDLEIGGAVLMDWPQKFIFKNHCGMGHAQSSIQQRRCGLSDFAVLFLNELARRTFR